MKRNTFGLFVVDLVMASLSGLSQKVLQTEVLWYTWYPWRNCYAGDHPFQITLEGSLTAARGELL